MPVFLRYASVLGVTLLSLMVFAVPTFAQDLVIATNTPRAPQTTETQEVEQLADPSPTPNPLEVGAQLELTAEIYEWLGSEVPYDPTACVDHIDGSELSAECAALIEAYPRPLVEQINQDGYTLDTYSFWRVGPDATPTYDAPNGNVSGEIPAGFNFVRAVNLSVEGWIQIEDGRWLNRDTTRFTQPSFFRGVHIGEQTALPFAYVLDLSQIPVSREPGGEWDASTGRFLRRYELVNIFSVAYDDEGWRWYMIGPNQWVEQRFMAKVQAVRRPQGVSGQWIAIDLYEQTLIAYEDDRPVFATLISTGLARSETNQGLFTMWARLARDGMSGATGAPNAYALQSVPWVMYFDGDISIHGTYWHDLFGYRQSRGCVNLSISDARWIFEWTAQGTPDETGNIPTPVFVYSSGEYGVTATGL